jgi:hypothetical protein
VTWAGPPGCHHGAMSRSNRAVFRMPAASAAIPLVAVLCVTPLATVGGGWWALYAIPVIAAVYIVVTRTTADAAQVTAYSLLGAKRMTWSDMDGLELRDARWTVAVGKDGRRLPLPMVRPRDLPRLAAASGGSLNLDAQASGDEDVDIAEGAVHDAAESADAGAAGDAGSATGAVSTTGDVTNDAPIRPAANAPDEGTSAQITRAQITAQITAASASDSDGRAITADAQGAGRASSAG